MDIPSQLDAERRQLTLFTKQAQVNPHLHSQRIALIENMLQRLEVNTYPAFRAVLLQNLGDAYCQRSPEDNDANLHRAIECYEQAVVVCPPNVSPVEYRRALTRLGLAFTNLSCGERLDNLKRAIAHYREALDACNPETDISDYGMILNALGATYFALPLGEGAVNLKNAITCYEGALASYGSGNEPAYYMMIRQNLGEAYARLPTGDRTENLRRAISCFEDCLRILASNEDPFARARLQVSLGDSYSRLLSDNLRQNLLRAIEHYREALSIFTFESAPTEYAQVQINLGNVYYLLPALDRADTLNKALACFKEALTVFSESDAWHFAAIQNNIGMIEADWLRGERREHLQKAIACYDRALSIYRLDTDPLEYPNVLDNLGSAHSDMWRLGEKDHWDKAITCFQQALQVYEHKTYPAGHRKVQAELGRLYMRAERWLEAQQAFQAALAAHELLYQATATDTSRQSELSESTDIYRAHAYCLARLGRLNEAVECLEMGRARTLAETLARDHAAFTHVKAVDREAFQILRDRIKVLEAESHSLSGEQAEAFVAISQQLHSVRDRLALLVEKIREYEPEFISSGVSLQEISAIARSDEPFVYLMTALPGGLALIVPHGIVHLTAEHAVWLDSMTEQDLDDLLYGHGGAQGLLDGMNGTDRAPFLGALVDTCRILGEKLMAPLTERMKALQYGRCLLVPCGRLVLFPLHAAILADSHYLDEILEVAYIP